MAKRKTPKQKKQKDDELLIDIVDAQEQAKDYVERNQIRILVGLLAFVTIVGGYFVYQNLIKGPQEIEATQQMHKAEFRFRQDSFALALTNPGGEFPGFLDIIDQYGGTKAGNMAKYYAGASYLNLGQYQNAIDYLTDFSPRGSVTPATSNGMIGDAHAELNQLDDALTYYKKAASSSKDEFTAPYYMMKAGMLMERQGDASGAKGYYENIKNQYPNSVQGQDIERYIARASSKN